MTQQTQLAKLADDPIFLEVFWARIRSIVNEAAKMIVRTSFSTLSTEANDFAVVLTDSNGRSLSENSGSIPSFIGTLPRTAQAAIAHFGKENMRPGDVFITNNPWIGTGHLNDVTMIKPLFHQGRIVAFAASTAHVPDIGGKIRSVDTRELFEEGFHMPLMHFLREGKDDPTLLQLLRTNVRTPEQTVGDIWAQVGALELIGRRLDALLGEYGMAEIDPLAHALFERSEAAMRAAIQALPDGTYHYEMQTDGFEEPFQYVIALTIAGDTITCDYAGTSPQQPRGINCVLAYTTAMSAYAIKALLLPDLPNNDGLFRPIVVSAPEGSLLNPRQPAPVGGRSCTGHYVPTVVFGAMAQVLPESVIGGAGSPLWVANFSGTRENGKPFATVLFYNGGMGGSARKDGASVMAWPSNISPTPVEVAEREAPLLFKYKALRGDSGGAGRHRGGLGEEVCFVSRHATPMSVIFMTERTRIPAPGIAGGAEGGCGEVLINGVAIDNRKTHWIQPGDEIILRTPGGGGYGPPRERESRHAEHDQRQGYTGRQQA
ncbi:hydantoinase B/oxoprolinase family protein [Bordetella sp. N]|uniref:hydantoinase B/oxoprolinase family protein n=1 Tax=Bordetella sp. N TaxID=1746199 RepID=UPI00070FB19B|nr:hydantoinase B/oxoprolinase family protein [Bordetella sp. N]ALM85645.1 hydantoinase [Bordetella sp. N]